MSTRAQGYAAVVRGAFRGLAVLFVGGVVHPAVLQLVPPLGYAWLPLVAVAAFGTAAVVATPRGSPVAGWRQGPIAAVAGYALIVPLVVAGTGQLPVSQLLLTTLTAVLVGAVVGLGRTHLRDAREASSSTPSAS